MKTFVLACAAMLMLQATARAEPDKADGSAPALPSTHAPDKSAPTVTPTDPSFFDPTRITPYHPVSAAAPSTRPVNTPTTKPSVQHSSTG